MLCKAKYGTIHAMTGDHGPGPEPKSLFGTLDRVLRGGYTQRRELASGQIAVPVRRLITLCLLLGGSYGVCLGSFAALRGADSAAVQVLASALKVPLLFVLTLLVSFPSLYVFGALQRLPLDGRNTLRLMLLAIVVNLCVVASLGPVFAFFAASSTSYPFLLLLNVAIFAIGGLLGLMVLRRATREMFRPPMPVSPPSPPPTLQPSGVPSGQAPGAPPLPPIASAGPGDEPARHRLEASMQTRRLLQVWGLVYGVVGAQMGWLLRPFLGSPDAPFQWFRDREGNFLVAVLHTIKQLFER